MQNERSDESAAIPRPSLLFWVLVGIAYAVCLGLGLAFPMLGRMTARLNLLVNMLGYILAGLAMIGASFFLALMICRMKLPYVWWMHRILGQDVSEFDGVFFVGGSVDRLSSQARSKVFSADDALSRWDIIFGVMIFGLTLVHGGAAYVSHALLKMVVFSA
jgi:hypothetical protein